MDTMRYTIWHVKQPTFDLGAKPVFPDFYDRVAIVEAQNRDDVFRIGNHIDSDWTKNPEVIQCFKRPVRSTSVGDVVEDENGNKHYVAPVGWKEVLEM